MKTTLLKVKVEFLEIIAWKMISTARHILVADSESEERTEPGRIEHDGTSKAGQPSSE